VLFGLLGMDHFYLRSFHTGMMKILLNACTFGLWHYWDLIQIVYDGRKIREEGLTTPFDWMCGIGRGVFTSAKTDEDPKKYVAEKSYLLYAFLAVFFGFLGADKFYMGETWQGIAKLLSVFNIFLFLFGFIWVVWDSVHALFMTKSILENGISAPLPYNLFFKTPIDGKQFLVNRLVDHDHPLPGFFDNLPVISIPQISYSGMYKDIIAPLMSPAVVAALHMKTPELPDPPTMPGMAKYGLPKEVTGVPTVGLGIPVSQTQPAAPTPAPAPAQTGGGGVRQDYGPGPAIAGVLTAVVLAGGLKGFYDIISKQYG
jgi:TM2 domain-containing membrane protein YozV